MKDPIYEIKVYNLGRYWKAVQESDYQESTGYGYTAEEAVLMFFHSYHEDSKRMGVSGKILEEKDLEKEQDNG